MEASGITKEQLDSAAASVGVTLDARALNQKGTRWRVKVNPITEFHQGPRGGRKTFRKYQRTSASVMFHEGRKVHAVCWHGFRDFFRAAFALAPQAIFRTAMDTWRGSDDFEARYRTSGHRNIGSQAAPVCAAEACICGEEGMAV